MKTVKRIGQALVMAPLLMVLVSSPVLASKNARRVISRKRLTRSGTTDELVNSGRATMSRARRAYRAERDSASRVSRILRSCASFNTAP